jgi:error-prone DNA polymerase
MPLGEHVLHDYRSVGLSLKAHPVSFLRRRLNHEGVLPNASLSAIANGKPATVAGLVLVRQRPGSAKGVIFMTLEDEEAIANIVVWPKIFERFRPVVLGARFVRGKGRLQSASDVVHVVAETIEDLTPWLGALSEAAHPADDAELPPEAAQAGRDYEHLSRQAGKLMPKGRNFQ